jgi:uncharacterized protein
MARKKEEPKRKMTVAEAGRKGGEQTALTHGPKFYARIGRKGGQRVRDLVQRGKRTVKGTVRSTARAVRGKK